VGYDGSNQCVSMRFSTQADAAAAAAAAA